MHARRLILVHLNPGSVSLGTTQCPRTPNRVYIAAPLPANTPSQYSQPIEGRCDTDPGLRCTRINRRACISFFFVFLQPVTRGLEQLGILGSCSSSLAVWAELLARGWLVAPCLWQSWQRRQFIGRVWRTHATTMTPLSL